MGQRGEGRCADEPWGTEVLGCVMIGLADTNNDNVVYGMHLAGSAREPLGRGQGGPSPLVAWLVRCVYYMTTMFPVVTRQGHLPNSAHICWVRQVRDGQQASCKH